MNQSHSQISPIRTGFLTLLGLFLLAFSLQAAADTDFIRLNHDENGELQALQVSIARYINADQVELDLISAVHVGDAAYFHDLNRRFEDYDSVLYELVTNDPEAAQQRSNPAFSVIGLMQGGMTEALGLSYQLDEIDYTPSNFVHADMTVAEFQQDMRERGESMLGTFVRAWSISMAMQGQPSSQPAPNMLAILFAEDRQRALKKMMAEQLANPEQLELLLNPEQGSALITGRNGKALEVLEQQIAAGDQLLAIFYGAGHMPDFHERLLTDHGFELQSMDWIDAWRFESD